ncbi:MAG: hypothetical protein EBY75_07435 [Actinobacteria bacterium]|nr:hypothetical protein [Actinomycetota bacterium]
MPDDPLDEASPRHRGCAKVTREPPEREEARPTFSCGPLGPPVYGRGGRPASDTLLPLMDPGGAQAFDLGGLAFDLGVVALFILLGAIFVAAEIALISQDCRRCKRRT